MADRLIITDSTSDILPAEAEKYGIVVVPLGIQFEDDSTTYLEGVNLTYAEYFAKVDAAKELPKTSQPAPETYAEHIRRAQAEGKDVLIITISTGLSGTYQSACVAKDLVGYDRVFVFDSRTCICGMRILVEEALKRTDLSTEELVAHLEDVRSRIRLYAAVDRLDGLRKGGRLNAATYVIGSLAHIKLLVTVGEEGRAEMADKKLGIKAVIRAIASKLRTVPRDPDYPACLAYVQTQDNVNLLRELISEEYPDWEMPTYPAGASIGTHIGLNASAIVYVAKDKNVR